MLLYKASELDIVNKEFRRLLTRERIQSIVSLIPEEWLIEDSPFESVAEHRSAYIQFLESRIKNSDLFVKEAQHARESVI